MGHVKLGHVKLARAKLNAPNWHVIVVSSRWLSSRRMSSPWPVPVVLVINKITPADDRQDVYLGCGGLRLQIHRLFYDLVGNTGWRFKRRVVVNTVRSDVQNDFLHGFDVGMAGCCGEYCATGAFNCHALATQLTKAVFA